MPHMHEAGKAPRVPTPDEVEIVGLVPLLEPFFRGGVVRELMPAPLREAMETNGLTRATAPSSRSCWPGSR